MLFSPKARARLAIIAVSCIIMLTVLAATQKNLSSNRSQRTTADTLLPVLPTTLLDYTFALPAHLQAANVVATDNTPANNPVTDAGATLGRVLFFDKKLSQNYTISCGSCHAGEFGFSDSAKLSEGFLGGRTGRNSMGLTMARFYEPGRFFWDERAATLEDQVLMPIQDHVEMGLTLDTLVGRVRSSSYYPSLFTAAFGDPTIDELRISRAMAQFVRSMVSTNSKYDVGRAQTFPRPAGAPFPNFTQEENDGKTIFFGRGNCNACHGTDAFVAPAPRNNGLDLIVQDSGVFHTTGNRRDIGRFKANSLRNIALSAPFMHDGRFATLAQVVEHYNSGVQDNPTLDPQLRNPAPDNTPRRLNLSNAEKNSLVAFMRTLTDQSMTQDERWNDPFQRVLFPTHIAAEIDLEEMKVYPNPFSEILNIELPNLHGEEAMVRLVSLEGRLVWRTKTTSNLLQIQRNDIKAGLYWLDVVVGNTRSGKKIVVN